MAIKKVTDPARMTTDPVLLKELGRLGIDKEYVEFVQDYAPRSKGKRHSPYAKFYRDRKSGKEFMVVSGLPMVDAGGNKVEAGWEAVPAPSPPAYTTKNNVFHAEVVVQTGQVVLTCRNDQPSGEKKGNAVVYRPQLFLDDSEILAGQPILLADDPMNPNYHQNTLEWDYGICKRRLRVIEGRIHGYWIFPQNPNGEVRIRYNQNQPRLKLSGYAINSDEEQITATEFAQAEYPLEIGDSATYYPDAHEETSSVDGDVYHLDGGELAWADLRTAAGTGSDDSGVYANCYYILAGATDWTRLERGIILFDTQGLPNDASISAATLSLYGRSPKSDELSITPEVNIYASTPFSNVALQADDFVDVGSTAFCNTPITYAGWNEAGYNDFALNGDPDPSPTLGLAAISKIGVSKFGVRDVAYDVGGAVPDFTLGAKTRIFFYTAEQGTDYKPKLVVTYISPDKESADTGSGVDAYVSLETGEIKTSSDAGSGAEGTPMQSATLFGGETGSGIEAYVARLLAAFDTGTGAEVSGLLKDLFASELGQGSDSFVAKIETPTKGGGMKLWI